MVLSLYSSEKHMSFWHTPKNEDEPMGTSSQSAACRSPEVCRSVAKEPRVIFSFLLVKKITCHSGESQNPVETNYKKAIVTIWIPDEDFVNAKASTKSSSGMPKLPGASEVDE